jgi:arsenical pump membrane protein
MLAQQILAAIGQAWPPFVLVAGLLLIGTVAAADGLFEAIGARLARAPLPPRVFLGALLALVAVVTAMLNLDTSVMFLTPVLVHAARRRRLDEHPFLYGSVFMANSATLLLPGSNLTNLLVLRHDSINGAAFAARMLPAWLVACALTAAFLTLAYRLESGSHDARSSPPLRFGLGAVSTLVAAALMLALRNAALPVLALGLAATALRRLRPSLNLRVLTPLFLLTVSLGTLGRIWRGPTHLLASSGRLTTAVEAAIGSLIINNLPATVLFSAQPVPHPRALLLGLDLGPNLAVTGSLSAFLWLQAAHTVNADASILTYSKLGALLVPLTLAGTLAMLALHVPHAM